MSVALISRALKAPGLSPAEKLTLVALAEHAGRDGKCWPSVETLAGIVGVDSRHVRRVIRRLEDAGHVTREASRGRSSNRYTVHPNPDTQTSVQPGHGDPGCQPGHGDPGCGLNPDIYPTQPGHPDPPNLTEPKSQRYTSAALEGCARASGEFFDQLRCAANAPEGMGWMYDPALSNHVARWRALGLTDGQILDTAKLAAEKLRAKKQGMASPAYLDGPMQDAAQRARDGPAGSAKNGGISPAAARLLRKYGSSGGSGG